MSKIQIPAGQFEAMQAEGLTSDLENFEPIPEAPEETTLMDVEPEEEPMDLIPEEENLPDEFEEELAGAEPVVEEVEEPVVEDEVENYEEGQEVTLPDGEKMRFVEGEWKYVLMPNGEEALYSPSEVKRMRYSNAAITQSFQELAVQRAEVERLNAEAKQYQEIGNLFNNPTPVVPAPKEDIYGFGDPEPEAAPQADSALAKEVQRLSQIVSGMTTVNTEQQNAIKSVNETIVLARELGINVPDNVTNLEHAMAAESGGIGTPQFYKNAQDSNYVIRKLKQLYSGEATAPVQLDPALRNKSLRKPPVPTNRTKKITRAPQQVSTKKELEKKLANAMKKTNEINSGPDQLKWAVKVQEYQTQLRSLN